MKIRIVCTDDELIRTDDIQDAFNDFMFKLTKLGFTGSITIEEESHARTTKQKTLI